MGYNRHESGDRGMDRRSRRDPEAYRDRDHRWDRNLDDSRGSHQRESGMGQSFGYGDGYAEGPNYAGNYDTVSNHENDRREERDFRPLSGSFGFGPSSSSQNQHGARDWGMFEYRQNGSHNEQRFRDRNWRDQPRRHDAGSDEGIWDSVKSFFGKGPKGWKRSDERIREEVCEALARHPAIDASEMEVLVSDGVVTLKGSADNRFTKRRVEDVVEDIPGVEDIRNELQVRRQGSRGAETLSPKGAQGEASVAAPVSLDSISLQEQGKKPSGRVEKIQ